MARKASTTPSDDEEESAPRLAHRLKGGSASLGATELAALCSRIEKMDTLPRTELPTLLVALRLEAARVATAVGTLLAATPVTA